MLSEQLIGDFKIIDVQKSAHIDVGVAERSLKPDVATTAAPAEPLASALLDNATAPYVHISIDILSILDSY
ncbi:hypothetical protein IFM61606_06227 [Aspergillus udagawae]|uniref:Uncharacterized protein n=1 Tax=Aspergillus udagawae TaxID=91492 RepID=A0ABQ1A4T8_9EURO|nr:hypothetical protein IFM51744_01577 [Aspergillus udagawae]GFF73580.1 hypothetical protein IFM53868_01106 [Aspergillus udagawae]GFG26253.1 hypothetical protein IFM61606_06227 [Aspergillus udagawae]